MLFQPECTGANGVEIEPLGPSGGANSQDPFYASTVPQVYAVAATTVLSYTLVIMLLITPRTFFVGLSGGGRSFLGGRGLISGATGSSSVIGIGKRPWLQKVATFTVAISLTIASVGILRVAQEQYEAGDMQAKRLRNGVVGSLYMRIIRIISDCFLMLAQAQTLIRLFPRHREQVIIKWTGFALISLHTIFSILNNFVHPGKSRPHRYSSAIPALNYLFQLALRLLYAAWVIYYSISKGKVAFYHRRMRNISFVAILSLASVLVPLVFFVLDITQRDLARWGDYVRWVGAAAASVVVWEWVERIEALEREERRDGILGREIFDGDEMETTPSMGFGWPGRRLGKRLRRGKGFTRSKNRQSNLPVKVVPAPARTSASVRQLDK